MALTKDVSYSGKFYEDGVVEVVKFTQIYEDGELIAERNHNRVITPGMDYSNEPQVIRKICKALHTPEAITEYAAKIAALQAELEGSPI